jgi:hypothetical protein
MLHHKQDGHASAHPSAWLLLVHQLPTRPTNVRVRTWRRLQELGAVAVKNSVYALPNSPSTQEDFAWMTTEIAALGGQATVFAADAVETWSDDELKQAFRRARQVDYDELTKELTQATKGLRADALLRGVRQRRLQRLARTSRERLANIQAVDFFGATGRDAAAAALAHLEQRLTSPARAQDAAAPAAALDAREYRGRTWRTRARPGIDRIGSAWLIRKHIDPDAQFVFGDTPAASEAKAKVVTFDTYNGDFTHEGSSCTFETLTARFAITDAVTRRLGEIVHDLDLKDARFGAPETVAVGHLIEGLQRLYADDQVLLQRGLDLFEALYQGLQRVGTRSDEHAGAARSITRGSRPTRGRGASKGARKGARR